MSDPIGIGGSGGSRAAQMRQEFDQAFARPLAPETAHLEDLLTIRLGQEAYALRLSDIAGVFADRAVTALPGDTPALLGIAGLRGAIVPVYDLAALLGHDRDGERPRWLALTAASANTSVGFAFAALDGQLRIPRDDIVVAHDSGATDGSSGGGARRRYVRQFARIGQTARPIVDLAAVLDTIRRQASAYSNGGKLG